ncbi:MAG TPA: hypothetical protein VFJ29_00205 [Candidatus Kapabacteria bacterium]|nr:hypothetical protein [Candidatus Kapabacteria bacterium]
MSRSLFSFSSKEEQGQAEEIYSNETVASVDDIKTLPVELQYIIARNAGMQEQLRMVTGSGKSIAVRKIIHTPPRVLEAVHNISVHSQHRLILSWLRPLLREGTLPRFTENDRVATSALGIDLDEEVDIIRDQRLEFVKIVLMNERNRGITSEEESIIAQINSVLEPVAIEHAVNRIEYDNAHERTEVAQAIVKALLIIGPITHVLELYTHGLGKVFAASSDDVLSELAELQALRGSGFTWRQFIVRSRVLIPVLILATIGAFEVETLIENGYYFIGGVVFGLSAVALSLTTAIQSIGLYKKCVDDLCHEKKLVLATNGDSWRMALRQDFTNPARVGLFLGACFSPIASMVVFVALPEWTHNGWALAMLGTMETIVAGVTVILAGRLNDVRFRGVIRKRFEELTK